jgi:hypothetical protein
MTAFLVSIMKRAAAKIKNFILLAQFAVTVIRRGLMSFSV